MPGVLPLQPFPVFHDPNQQSVHSNATLTVSGSTIFTGYGAAEVSLFINVKAAPTGTLPTLQFTIQEVDPGDGTTVIGTSVSSTVISGVGVQRVTLLSTYGGSIKVSWTITGTGPSFTQVFATLTAKVATALLTDGVNGPVTVKPASTAAVATDVALVVSVSPNNTLTTTNPSVGLTGVPPPGSGTYISGNDGTNLVGLRLKPASTAAVATDPALVVTIGPNTPLPAGTNTLGFTNQGTPASLSNAWTFKITDATNGPVAVKAPSTAAVATDPALVVTVSPNNSVAITAAALPLPAGAATAANQTTLGNQTTKINDGTNTAVIKPAATAATAADPALVVTFSPNSAAQPQDVVGTGALGALNAAVTVIHPGLQSVGFQLVAGTLVGTLVPEVSFDGGVTWVQTFFYNPTTGNIAPSLVFSIANTSQTRTILTTGGEGQVRVRVSAFTSGTANATVRATSVHDQAVTFAGAAGSSPLPPTVAQVGGKDPAGLLQPMGLTTEQSVQMSPAPNRQPVHSNSTITVSGSSILDDTWGAKEVSLFINIKAAPTGTTPTITYTVQEVDPGDNTTVLGTSVTGTALTAIGTQILTLPITKSGIVKVSWVVTGTTPSFTQVFSTLTSKIAGSAILYDTAGLPLGTPANPINTTQVISTNASVGLAVGRVVLGGGSSGTVNAIRATAYTEQTTNAQRSISSSSASDTGAGVGAQQVTITYYTATGTGPFTEVVTLNGVAAVNTVSSTICFIEHLIVTRVGSTTRNVGTITLFAGTGGGGGTIGTIGIGTIVAAQGDNRTYWAHHYIPPGVTASFATVVCGLATGTGSSTGTFFLRSRDIGVTGAAEVHDSDLLAVATGAGLVRQLGIPLKVSGPARITGYVVPAGNNTTCDMSFDFSEI